MHKIDGPGATDRTDPDYAPTAEVFEHLAYADIHRGVAQLNPTVLTAGRQAWEGAATAVAEAVEQAHAEIRDAAADGWRGRAATTAAGAVRAFEELGRHLSDVMAEVGHRLGEANDAAETLRASISQPPSGPPDLEGALLDPRRAVTNVAGQKAAEDARQEAVRVMNTVYAGVFLPTGSGVPAFDDTGLYPSPPAASAPPETPSGGDGPVSSATAAAPAGQSAPGPAAAPADRYRAETASPDGDFRTVGSHAETVPNADATQVSPPPSVVPAAATDPALAVLGRNAKPVAAQPVRSTGEPAAPPPALPGPATPIRTRTSDTQRDRENRDRRNESAPASTGAGVDGAAAGIIGGLAGGIYASGDSVRSGGGAAAVRPLPFEEEDEDEFYDDDLTFLEPAEPGTDLIGEFDPTTPPVLGEWSGNE
ncbi:hypothetical protein [Nocardia sp. BMG111209]|uniref:PPE domain-containing protein n=1 Tax=Nocardia sp. BMG111209 TaxID=1160137 RepID=UPI00038173D9|nr:hypothetical protein [Nocardia sp. BMG111209]